MAVGALVRSGTTLPDGVGDRLTTVASGRLSDLLTVGAESHSGQVSEALPDDGEARHDRDDEAYELDHRPHEATDMGRVTERCL